MTRPARLGTETLGALALLALTMGWGSTFFMTKDLLARMPVVDYLGVRFAIAALALLAVAPRAVTRLSRAALAQSVLLGALYGFAQILQTSGLDRTPASTAGFVTGLYVVMTPLLAAPLLHQRIPGAAWVAVVLATAGMAVLSLRGFHVGAGELLVLASAVLYALHICGLGAWSTPESSMGSSIVQLVVIAVICLTAAVPDGVTLPHTGVDWVRMLYMGIIVGALGMLAQVWAQAHLPPTRSAVIMSMEPVFAALFAVLFGGESATVRMLVGGLMVLAAMLLVELAPRRKVEAEVLHPAQ
ncbi:DMT family transporter [Nocardioides sp. Iso805N]|uniref:DMT family transporter n=1 Tax=Nocardioides sp. Iso805N TaxID=1283287 RepID=UPI00037E7132|nr:DMT family transporter [Nocardioides sp. Iso805N]